MCAPPTPHLMHMHTRAICVRARARICSYEARVRERAGWGERRRRRGREGEERSRTRACGPHRLNSRTVRPRGRRASQLMRETSDCDDKVSSSCPFHTNARIVSVDHYGKRPSLLLQVHRRCFRGQSEFNLLRTVSFAQVTALLKNNDSIEDKGSDMRERERERDI